MTDLLFRDDPYLAEPEAPVLHHTPEGGIVLDRSVFYPTSGGQPGDSGRLVWQGGTIPVATAVKAEGGHVALVPSEPVAMPPPGTVVQQQIDWTRRHRHMRVHTALHLLSVVIPLPVTGGQISADRGRLDFDMPEVPDDIAAIEAQLNEWISDDHAVTSEWITETEMAAQPDLIKTMKVKPPMGQGRVRLIRIGNGEITVDLQPCGGTHVANTGEIGGLRIGKIEKKGKQNRRVNLHFAADMETGQ